MEWITGDASNREVMQKALDIGLVGVLKSPLYFKFRYSLMTFAMI